MGVARSRYRQRAAEPEAQSRMLPGIDFYLSLLVAYLPCLPPVARTSPKGRRSIGDGVAVRRRWLTATPFIFPAVSLAARRRLRQRCPGTNHTTRRTRDRRHVHDKQNVARVPRQLTSRQTAECAGGIAGEGAAESSES